MDGEDHIVIVSFIVVWFYFFYFFLEKWFTRFIKHFSLNTILYHSIEKHKNSINIESDNRKCLKVYCWEGGMGS